VAAKIFIRNVPGELRERLIADASAQNSNMNAVAIRILADRYGIRIDDPPARRATADPDITFLMLRPPPELRRAISSAAASRDGRPGYESWTRAKESLAALLDHYQLDGQRAAA
jgi:hypothetical protein